VRVIAVMDLAGGRVVHAVRGERERYRALQDSRIAAGADPLGVARAFRSRLGLEEVYVADLDAIAGRRGHDDVVAAVAREGRVLLDAGTTWPGEVRRLLALGVERVVVGTETLAAAAVYERLCAALPASPPVLSLDLRAGRVLSPDAELAALQPAEALARLVAAGAREAIVLDLARVGSGEGPDVDLIARLRERFGELALLAGGGVRDAADLRALRDAGAAGALVATALHTGAIGREELDAL
jgi:phosphoribosylformimino-5-aminoimidazole carboxamide ribotide isomerase